MSRPGISLAGLIRIVLAVALGLAALRSPSCLWASAAFSLLLLSLARRITAGHDSIDTCSSQMIVAGGIGVG